MYTYIYIYIFIYMCMDALVSRYLTSLLLGPFCSIGGSMHREVVGGARVREGGDGGGLGNRKLYFVSCSYLDRNYTLPVLPLWILRRGK